jgi:hypothetical protein
VAVELDHPGFGGEVDAVGFDLRPRSLQLLERGGQLAVLGGDQQIEAFLGEDLGQLVADSTRGAGDDGKRLSCDDSIGFSSALISFVRRPTASPRRRS